MIARVVTKGRISNNHLKISLCSKIERKKIIVLYIYIYYRMEITQGQYEIVESAVFEQVNCIMKVCVCARAC